MEESRIIEIKEDILADNTNAANDFRKMLENQGTFFVDVMASPGAGKTTLLLALIEELRKSASSKQTWSRSWIRGRSRMRAYKQCSLKRGEYAMLR